MKKITKPFLRNLITEGELELAIKRMLNLINGIAIDIHDVEISHYRNSLILLATRLNEINEESIMGIASENQYKKKNELTFSTLSLIDDLPTLIFSPQNLQKEQTEEEAKPGLQSLKINIIDDNELNRKEHHKITETDFIKQMQKIKAFSEQIEGYWWEKVLPDDGSAISFVLIEMEGVACKLKFNGKAYGVDGMIISKWHSISCSVDLSQTSVFYVWNGWYYKEPSILKNGWGKIDFIMKSKSFNSGDGRFSDVYPSKKEYRTKTATMFRCSKKEQEIMISGNQIKRKELVLKKLQTLE